MCLFCGQVSDQHARLVGHVNHRQKIRGHPRWFHFATFVVSSFKGLVVRTETIWKSEVRSWIRVIS